MKTAVTLLTAALAASTRLAGAQGLPPSGQLQWQGPAAAQQCVVCHGVHGEGNPAAGFPRIAGQSRYYLAKQLQSYADGSRRNPAMEAISKDLSPQDMAAVAAYYAQSDARAAAGTGATAAFESRNAQGHALAVQGDRQLRLQACNSCHGPGGVGIPPTIPYLAGLDAGYMVGQLNAWKDGARQNDTGQQMRTIASALTAEAAVAVSQYYAGLPPPEPAPTGVAQAPGAKPASGVAPGQGSSGAPATGKSLASGQQPIGDPARGRAIIAAGEHGCAACHTIPGIRGSRGVVGPPLGGQARRGFIAGQLPNDPEVLVAFLRNPPALVPRTGMPDVGLSPREAGDIAAFLYTLEPSDAR